MAASVQEHITIEPETLGECRQAYLQKCRSERKKPGTIEVYERVTGRLVDYLVENGIALVQEVRAESLRDYFKALQADHNKGGVDVYYRPIKAMFRWLWTEYEWETRNPIDRVKIEHAKIVKRPGIPMEDFAALRDSCWGKYKLRDQAILCALLDTCCRVTEFCNLRIKDVNFVTGRVWVEFGKGDKTRAVRLGEKTLRLTRKYLKTRGVLKPNDPLFLNDDGDPFDRFGMRSLMERRSADAGVNCPGMHDFRRRGLYLLWKTTRDMLAVSEYAGHSSPVVTQRYIDTEEDDIQEMHRSGSPVDNL
jgi:integrase